MKTTFEHKFNIGDTVYYIDGIIVEETVVCGISFIQHEDRDNHNYGKIRTELDYRLEGNVYRTEDALYGSFLEASETHNFREYYETKIRVCEETIQLVNRDLEKYKAELEKIALTTPKNPV